MYATHSLFQKYAQTSHKVASEVAALLVEIKEKKTELKRLVGEERFEEADVIEQVIFELKNKVGIKCLRKAGSTLRLLINHNITFIN